VILSHSAEGGSLPFFVPAISEMLACAWEITEMLPVEHVDRKLPNDRASMSTCSIHNACYACPTCWDISCAFPQTLTEPSESNSPKAVVFKEANYSASLTTSPVDRKL